MIYGVQLTDSFFSLQRENLSLAFKTGETVGIVQTLVSRGVLMKKNHFTVKPHLTDCCVDLELIDLFELHRW